MQMNPGDARLTKAITEVQTRHVSAHMAKPQESGVSEARECNPPLTRLTPLERFEWGGLGKLFKESYEEASKASENGFVGDRVCYQA